MSVEKTPWIIWKLAYGVYPIYPMGVLLSLWKNPSHASEDTQDGYPYRFPWFHYCASTSVCFLSTEKKGVQALGRSKGWLTTKIHAFAVSIKEILSFILTPGNTSDTPIGNTMIDCLPVLRSYSQIEHTTATKPAGCWTNETLKQWFHRRKTGLNQSDMTSKHTNRETRSNVFGGFSKTSAEYSPDTKNST